VVAVWGVWVAVLLALLIPRPVGLTVIRTAAADGLVLAFVTAPATTPTRAVLAITSIALVAGLVSLPSLGSWCVNGPAYGGERRFPLRVPPPLYFGTLPVAVLAAPLGATAGPLLLADGRIVPGLLATVAGGPLAAALARSLHSLSRRWLVLVPAGLVVHDPLTLADPVLFPRERIARLECTTVVLPDGTLDLRLSARGGTLVVTLTDDAPLLAAGRGRRPPERVTPRVLAVAPSRPGAVLAAARARRIPVP
jgi:hypothetical protein